MKKIVLILGFFLCFNVNAWAELYHGIDIDTVYESSDWSSKEKIKKIIDDYNLLLQYQKKLYLCSGEVEKLSCMDTLTENIIKNFYDDNVEQNLNDYHNYVKSASAVYGIVYCLNKYRIPSGTMCNQETIEKTWKIVEQYDKDLLQSVEQILSGYSFLKEYKN